MRFTTIKSEGAQMRAVHVLTAAALASCATPDLFLSLMADAGIYEYEPSSPDSTGT